MKKIRWGCNNETLLVARDVNRTHVILFNPLGNTTLLYVKITGLVVSNSNQLLGKYSNSYHYIPITG